MIVESFNLTLFKRLTASCALILQELYDEHEQKVARVHLIGLLAEEEDKELLAEVENELHAQEEGKELLEEEEDFKDNSDSCAVEQEDYAEVDNSPASSLIEENLVPAENQGSATVQENLKSREKDLNISADKEAEDERNLDPMTNLDFD